MSRLGKLAPGTSIKICFDNEARDGFLTIFAEAGCQVLSLNETDGAQEATVRKTGKTENCMTCGSPLEYLTQAEPLVCQSCGREELGYVRCARGHYLCEDCHGKEVVTQIETKLLTSNLPDPIEIAEKLMADAALPMLGCEHALISCGSLLAGLRNQNLAQVSDDQIRDALNRTRRQAISAYCGLTGICGVAPSVGAAFSVLLEAKCSGDQETAAVMRVTADVIEALSEQTGPCCCKNFVRTALLMAPQLAKEHLGLDLAVSSEPIGCTYSNRHPHGCRQEKCRFYAGEKI